MPSLSHPWRSYRTLKLNDEAACAAACCYFSFVTLEISCRHPGEESFALTEQRHAHNWRWAICNTQGMVLKAGSESTQSDAKKVAEDALQLEIA